MTACEKAMAGKGKTAPADAPQTIGEKVAAYRKKLEANEIAEVKLSIPTMKKRLFFHRYFVITGGLNTTHATHRPLNVLHFP